MTPEYFRPEINVHYIDYYVPKIIVFGGSYSLNFGGAFATLFVSWLGEKRAAGRQLTWTPIRVLSEVAPGASQQGQTTKNEGKFIFQPLIFWVFCCFVSQGGLMIYTPENSIHMVHLKIYLKITQLKPPIVGMVLSEKNKCAFGTWWPFIELNGWLSIGWWTKSLLIGNVGNDHIYSYIYIHTVHEIPIQYTNIYIVIYIYTQFMRYLYNIQIYIYIYDISYTCTYLMNHWY